MKIAVFPGSFDPVTIGHIDIISRSFPLFDKIIVGVGVNSRKQTLFTPEQRIKWIKSIFMNEEKVEVQQYSGLTIDFCKSVNARFLLRGLRSAADFDYERVIAQLNHSMNKDVETIFLASKPEYSHISSTIVREILINNGDARQFLPPTIAEAVKSQLKDQHT